MKPNEQCVEITESELLSKTVNAIGEVTASLMKQCTPPSEGEPLQDPSSEQLKLHAQLLKQLDTLRTRRTIVEQRHTFPQGRQPVHADLLGLDSPADG